MTQDAQILGHGEEQEGRCSRKLVQPTRNVLRSVLLLTHEPVCAHSCRLAALNRAPYYEDIILAANTKIGHEDRENRKVSEKIMSICLTISRDAVIRVMVQTTLENIEDDLPHLPESSRDEG